ncbi:hypothetical protein [Pseudooceanicola nanhaiensis]|uniref:hypothetical protein n=1 Tax=Pseudooceanicola nanhaiensis TaxID=375761 RepID=UPI001CD75FD2|nr:hypothetical protein [Pseudooceanicola nanhaiensis]MCA0919841.1 hypothetical protein [Pseudooceanicola nanhaiensis]
MTVAEDLADALARDVLASAPHLGDEHDLIREIAKVLAASSTTTEEAFMTAIRVRIAERRGRALLNQLRAEKGLPPVGTRPAGKPATKPDPAQPARRPAPKPPQG